MFLLVCISLNLYISVDHTKQICSRTRPYMVQLICLVGWIFSILLSIPDWMYLKAARVPAQEDSYECVYMYSCTAARMASYFSFLVLGFLLPFIVLLYCFVHVLLQCRSKMGVPKQRAVQVTFALVLVFFISWTPFNAALLMDTFNFSSGKPAEYCEKNRWTAVKITAILGFLHSCLNPLIYFGFSEKFRHWILSVIKCDSCAVDSGDYFLWDSKEFHRATPVPQEENGALQPMNNIQHMNDEML